MLRTLLTEFMMHAPYQPATNYWRAVETEEIIKYDLPKGRGLDLGCGDGHLMAILTGHAGRRELAGLDIDPRETAIAQARNIYGVVVSAPADNLPFRDCQFDFIFSNSVLEHIGNIEGVLKEVARVLRPSGRFLFTVPGENFHRCLRGPWLWGDRELYLRETDARCSHLRYWSARQWSEELRKVGLTQIHQHEYLTLAQVQRWESIVRFTSGPLYRLLGSRKKPVEIQRQMRIRSLRVRLPRVLASLSAGVMNLGFHPDRSYYGCLLVEATKRDDKSE